MVLSTKVKQSLKAKAHKLKPVILVGNQGLTKGVHAEIDRALTDHELIKVRFPACEKEVKKALAAEIAETHLANFIQMVGNVCVFYRKRTETDKGK